MEADTSIRNDNNKTVLFNEVVVEIERNGDDQDDKMYGPPQVICFLFACNTIIPIMHEMQAYEGWEIVNTTNPLDPGHVQFYMILSIDIESKEKAMRRQIQCID